jgi:hypothetical protein
MFPSSFGQSIRYHPHLQRPKIGIVIHVIRHDVQVLVKDYGLLDDVLACVHVPIVVSQTGCDDSNSD